MHAVTPPRPLPPLPTAGEERAAAVAYMQEAGDRLAAENIARGEHVRGRVEQRRPPRDVRPGLDALLAAWRAAWDQTPPAQRAVETAAAYAAQLAAGYVERLDAAGLERLHDFCGFPPAWSRPHAVASITAFLVGGFGQWLAEREGR